jgi:hypothetical protein
MDCDDSVLPPNPKLAFENPEEFRRLMNAYVEKHGKAQPDLMPVSNEEAKEDSKRKKIGKILADLRLYGQIFATPEELAELGVNYADLTRMLFAARYLRDDED